MVRFPDHPGGVSVTDQQILVNICENDKKEIPKISCSFVEDDALLRWDEHWSFFGVDSKCYAGQKTLHQLFQWTTWLIEIMLWGCFSPKFIKHELFVNQSRWKVSKCAKPKSGSTKYWLKLNDHKSSIYFKKCIFSYLCANHEIHDGLSQKILIKCIKACDCSITRLPAQGFSAKWWLSRNINVCRALCSVSAFLPIFDIRI